MTGGLDLVHVRKGRGRIHLTAAVAAGRPVQTLCGKELTGVEVTEAEADCHLCVRRQHDPAVISSAFFNQEEGSRLLELSLEAARRKREQGPDLKVVQDRPAPAPERRTPPAPPPPPPPTQRGELRLAGMRQFSEDVYTTPMGMVVRMDGDRIAEVTGGGAVRIRRIAGGLQAQLGDLVLEEREGALEARLADS